MWFPVLLSWLVLIPSCIGFGMWIERDRHIIRPTQAPLPFAITVATMTRSERRRLRRNQRDLNRSLSDRVN